MRAHLSGWVDVEVVDPAVVKGDLESDLPVGRVGPIRRLGWCAVKPGNVRTLQGLSEDGAVWRGDVDGRDVVQMEKALDLWLELREAKAACTRALLARIALAHVHGDETLPFERAADADAEPRLLGRELLPQFGIGLHEEADDLRDEPPAAALQEALRQLRENLRLVLLHEPPLLEHGRTADALA